jgi:ribonuclease HI
VHIPAHPCKQLQHMTVAVDCQFESEPGAPACVNTINRAELAAIRVAVTIGLKNCENTGDTEVHIATDSLASIFQVHRATTRPQDMREHRHLTLIQDIISLITDSIYTVHFRKVKRHIGIVGNEIADVTAVAVSKGRRRRRRCDSRGI